MLTNEVLKNVSLNTVSSELPINVIGIGQSSHDMQPGWLFFAMNGQKSRGADFVAEAQKNGAVAVVSEEILSAELPVIQVPNVRKALAICASNFYKAPTKRFYLNAVTGTNGKTSTTYILKKIWSEKRVGMMGTIETSYPGHHFISKLTTPASEDLQKCFSEMVSASTTHVTMEASSHAIEQARTFASEFDSAIFTNLTQDHLDYHLTLESYFSSKKNLFLRDLQNSSKQNKAAIINVDSKFGKDLAQELKHTNLPVITCSRVDSKANFLCKNFTSTLQGTEFQIEALGESYSGVTNLFGSYNIENLLGALAAGYHSGVALKTAISHVDSVIVPGRMEKIGSKNTFVDYAHTPDALERALTALNGLKSKTSKLIVVFGCAGDRDIKKRPIMGAIAESLADIVIVTSDNPRSENQNDILKDIESGMKSKVTNVFFETDRKKAIQMALEMQIGDDVILIAGKGHETYQIVGEQVFDFDDRKIVLDLL